MLLHRGRDGHAGCITGTHLAQLILFLHLPALVEMAQPDADLQPSIKLLLWVGFSRRQGGSLDAKLHAGFLRRHLVARAAISAQTKRSALCTSQKTDLVFQLSFPAAPPLLEDFSQLVEAGVVKVEDFILALSAGDHQLPARTGVVTGKSQGDLRVRSNQCNSLAARRDLWLT